MDASLRLLPTDARAMDYDDAEERRLRETMAAAPGVVEMRGIARHPKGGYVVRVVHEGDVEEMLDFVREAGWMGVL